MSSPIFSYPEEAGNDRIAVPPGSAHADFREALDTSRHGVPSAGEAVSDFFATDEIFHRVMATANDECHRTNRLLFVSGIAAGLSIGLTFLARAVFTGLFPDDETGLLGNLLYPVGFIFIVLGRYQLFTENTLTPVTLVLTRLAGVPRLLKIWVIVFTANVFGAGLAALLFSNTSILDPAAADAAYGFGVHAMEMSASSLFFRAVVAGWLVAGMVWLIHAARETVARFLIVYFIMFLVPSAGLFHCVIGACEIFYFIFEGGVSLGDGLLHFLLPVTLGNTFGGVLLVGLLNYAQTSEKRRREWELLSWREVFWGPRARGRISAP